MALPQSFLDELIYRCDIVDIISRNVRLNKAGTNYKGLCPFHNEKTPSFTVSREKQFFHCFGCGAGGNVITYVMKIENLDFIDAVRQLADYAGMTVPDDDSGDDMRKLRERITALNRDAARYFHQCLMSEQGDGAREYLVRRGLSKKSITDFGLGYADQSWDGLITAMEKKGYTKLELEQARLVSRGKNGNLYCFFRDRIMFPIIDVRLNVVAFGGRVLEGDGGGRKYMNSPDTPVYNKSRTLYGLNIAKKSKSGKIILAEGNMDVIALHGAGFDNAVATCGTALTREQARLIARYAPQVVLCYDADGAGQAATQKAIDILGAEGLQVRVLKLPPRRDEQGKILLDDKGRPLKDDPDDFIKRNGAESFSRLLDKPQTDTEYRISEIKSRFDVENEEQKLDYVKSAVSYIAGLKSAVERELFAHNIARETNISAQAIISEVERAIKSHDRREQKKLERDVQNPKSRLAASSREMRYSDAISAQREERLLVLALGDAELLEQAEARISSDEFSSPVLGAIYQRALDKLAQGVHITPASCLTELTPEQTEYIAAMLATAVNSNNPKAELLECIEKIKYQNIKNKSDDGDVLEKLLENRRQAQG